MSKCYNEWIARLYLVPNTEYKIISKSFLVSKINCDAGFEPTHILLISLWEGKFMFCSWKSVMFIPTESICSDDYVDMTHIHIEIAL